MNIHFSLSRITALRTKAGALGALLCLCLALPAQADRIELADENGNVLSYTFTGVDGEATLDGVSSFSADAEKAKRVVVPATITDESGNTHAVTAVGTSAFYDKSNLKEVVLGENIKALGYAAFEHCSALETLSLPDGLETVESYAFYRTALRELTFGTALKSINYGAFQSNDKLETVVFKGETYPFTSSNHGIYNRAVIFVPASMVETYKTESATQDYNILPIGTATAFSIAATAGGQLQEKVEAQGQAAAVLTLTVAGPINGTDIDYLHRYLTNVRTLDLGAAQIVNGGDTYHKWYVADNGTATQSNQVGNTAADIIGDYMFYNMPTLQKLVLPQTATVIGERALSVLPHLAEVTLPATLQTIGDYAFAQNGTSEASRVQHLTLPASVTSIGQYAFRYMTSLQDINIPEGVSEIPAYAFQYCSALRSISLPSTLRSIGERAFYETSALTAVSLADGLQSIATYAFAQSGLQSLVLPGRATTLGSYAFYYCRALRTVTVGEGIAELPNGIFSECSQLETVALPTTLETIDDYAFESCSSLEAIELPEGLLSLGHYALASCESLEAFTFPAAITTVPDNVLQSCAALKSVTLATGTTAIGSNAFYGCEQLAAFDFPATLTKIGSFAFSGTGLTAVELPNSVVCESRAFGDCPNLERINIPTAMTTVPTSFVASCPKLTTVQMHADIHTIGDQAFCQCTALENIDLGNLISELGSSAFQGCSRLALTALPTNLTVIGQYAFANCSALTTLTIPRGVSTIGTSAFRRSGLTEVALPVAIGSLGSYVFERCAALTRVDWPNNLANVPTGTFYECTALTDITLGKQLRTIGSNAFSGCSSLATINIPEGLETIESNAFYASGITEVTLPDALTSLGYYAFADCQQLKVARLGRNMDYTPTFDYFYNCENLDTLRVFSGTVPVADSYYAPLNRENCVLEVPMGMEESYAAAEVWKEFKQIIGFLTGDKLAAEDFALLKQFYAEMGGEGWTHGWDLTTDDRYIGKWHGVTTEGDHVKEISLVSNNLEGELKQTLFDLPELTTLDLSKNHIGGALDEVLATDFTNEKLTSVSLHSNRLTGDVAAFANKLPNLNKLFLQYNRLTEMSAPLSESLSSASEYTLNYGYQFVDYETLYGIDAPEQPAVRIVVGEPFELALNSLQQYRPSQRDFGFGLPGGLWSFYRRVYNEPYLTSGEMQLAQNSDGLYNVSTSTTFQGWKKGDIAPYEIGYEGYWGQRIVNLLLDWEDGDINCDLTVDVADMQSSIYYALEGKKPDDQAFNFSTADANEDENIDVRDVVLTIDRVLSYEEEPAALARALYIIMSGDEDDAACTASVQDGLLSIALPAAGKLTGAPSAAQFLLDGCTPDELALAAGARGFTLKAKQTAQGVKVVLYSLSSATLDGAVLRVPQGASLLDVRLTDRNAERLPCRITNATTVGISGVAEGLAAEGSVYDLEGRLVGTGDVRALLSKQPAGLYIINVDGKRVKIKK